MGSIKWILFDCMETLVDLTNLPTVEDYAQWAFKGSGCEKHWNGFDEYYKCYQIAREQMAKDLPQYKETDMYDRFLMVNQIKFPAMKKDAVRNMTDCIYRNYWKTYKSKCYVAKEIKDVLPELGEKYRLGVVSNFMVREGIEELLQCNGIDAYFQFIITSINEGWRKPHANIYDSAVKKAGVLPREILFVGDDYYCDVIGPEKIGMNTVLLDRKGKFPEIKNRIADFYGLVTYCNEKG